MSYQAAEKSMDRVQFDAEHLKFIDDLVRSSGTGPFLARANVLGFAAAYCLENNGNPSSIKTRITSKLGADPIRTEVMENNDTKLMSFIYMLSFISTGDPKILEKNELKHLERLSIFEEYANTGLKLLKTKLKGSVDLTRDVLLLVRGSTNSTTSDELENLEDLLDD